MNDQTVTAYRQLDAQARNYADLERAISTAKRRRRRTVAAASVTPVVLAGLLGAVVTLQPVRPDATPPPGTSTARVTLTDPGVLQPPAKRQTLGPAPVGRAVLAYAPCASACDAYVVLADGAQLVVPANPQGTVAGALSLSPDGGWLGYPMSGEYLLRNLTGTRVHRVGNPTPQRRLGAVAWSADSTRLLLFDEPSIGGDATYRLLDVGTGAVTTPAVPSGARAVGVLPDGAVLFTDPNQTGPTRTLSTTAGGRFTVTLAGQLHGGESTYLTSLAPDGRSVYLLAGTGDVATAAPRPTAVLHVALTGQPLGRYPVPTPGGSTVFWQPLGASPDGFVFARRAATSTTLVTVSAAGSREGPAVPAPQGVVGVRIPG
ncbi:MAG TPA: hypothetical protein VF755_18465 [Catenuloplanes sp.]